MSEINDPEVVAEVSALHDEYEGALVGNDVALAPTWFPRVHADGRRIGTCMTPSSSNSGPVTSKPQPS